MIYIILSYKGRKYSDIAISETNTIKEIMNICFDKINKPVNDRFYKRDKILFKFNDRLLNPDEESLNKTANEIEMMDDDNLTLVDTVDINAGKIIKTKSKIIFDFKY